MNFLVSISAAFLVLIICIQNATAQCNKCLSSANAECLSSNKFRVCHNGVATRKVFSCPANMVCANDPAICLPAANANAACDSQCGKCGANRKFACLSETTYAFCFGTTTPSRTIGTCPRNRVCSNSDPQKICVEPSLVSADCKSQATTTLGIRAIPTTQPTTRAIITSATPTTQTTPPTVTATTPTTTTTLTVTPTTPTTTTLNTVTPSSTTPNIPTLFPSIEYTTAPPTVIPQPPPLPVCTGPGRFPMPGSIGCKQYIYCYYYDYEWRSRIYTCSGSMIYYPPKNQCVRSRDYPCLN